MKKILILSLSLFIVSAASFATDFPVIEPFNGPLLYNTYVQFWTVDATLSSVPAASEECGDSPLGDGWVGKSQCVSTGATTSGHLTGEETDSDYTVQAYLYTRVVNVPDDGAAYDDWWYQMLVFYREDPGGYCRFHAHFNQTDVAGAPYPCPRLRVNVANPTFVYTTGWGSSDFTVPTADSWHKMKVEVTGTTALCYFDDIQLSGTPDWTTAAPTRAQGRFGFGQYQDAAADCSLYIDMFKCWKGAEPPDPTPTPPPLSADNWTHYE